MQHNRALRATALILLSWLALRSSYLITLSNAYQTPRQDSRKTPPPILAQNESNQPPISDNPMIKRDYHLNGSRDGKFKSQKYLPVSYDHRPPPMTKNIIEKSDIFSLINSDPEPENLPQDSNQGTVDVSVSNDTKSGRNFLNLSVSAWAIIRPASSALTLATNGQLGASQTGVRIKQPLLRLNTYELLALNFRFSKPLDQKKGGEVGLGIAVRPNSNVPVELIVERRIALDRRGRNAVAVIAAGGFDDKAIYDKMMLSGYAQGGIVGFSRKDGFVDAALRVEQALLDRNDTGLRVGAGIWAATQPGVSRIDVGPIIAIKQRFGSANIRISGEYRLRVSGKARPASGPALSVGTDF
jgi:hypothetical protein